MQASCETDHGLQPRLSNCSIDTTSSNLVVPQFPAPNQFDMAEEDGQEIVSKPFKFVTGKNDNPSLKNTIIF